MVWDSLAYFNLDHVPRYQRRIVKQVLTNSHNETATSFDNIKHGARLNCSSQYLDSKLPIMIKSGEYTNVKLVW